MTKNTLKTISLAIIAPVTLSLSSCDSGDDDASTNTPTITPPTTTLPTALSASDQITLTFSGGDSSLIGNIVSESLVRYTFTFGSEHIEIGVVPYTYSSVGDTKTFNSQPNQLDDNASIVAINNTITSNSTLRGLLGSLDLNNLSASDRRAILKLVNEGTANVVISVDDSNEFFLVETANLVAVGSNGTFIETGSTIRFSSSSVSLTGGESVLNENPTVTFE